MKHFYRLTIFATENEHFIAKKIPAEFVNYDSLKTTERLTHIYRLTIEVVLET